MKELLTCRNISLAVYWVGAVIAFLWGALSPLDASFGIVVLALVSGFGLYCTLRCCKSSCDKVCPVSETKE